MKSRILLMLSLIFVSSMANATSMTNKEFSLRAVTAALAILEDDLSLSDVEVRAAPAASGAVAIVNAYGRLNGECYAKGLFVFDNGLGILKAAENPLADLVCK